MSNSYIVELERLRALLENILDEKGVSVESGEPLNTLIPKVNSIGINDEFKKMVELSDFDIIDTEGLITVFNNYLNTTALPHLKRLSLPMCSSLAASSLKGSSITELNLPACQVFYDNCLDTVASLTDLTVSSNITTVGKMFCSSAKFTELNLNTVGTIDYGFLRNNSLLIKFSLQSCNSFNSGIGSAGTNYGSFEGCSLLKICDLGVCNTITNTSTVNWNAFKNCTNFKALVLRKTDAVTTLSHGNIFNWLKNHVSGWFIYVPDSLVNTYKAASNWSNYADYFKPLSEYDENAILNPVVEE